MRSTSALDYVSRQIDSLRSTEPLRVAVDGIDASGKTVFANSLAIALRKLGYDVLRVSIDDFREPRSRRYARGRESPEGYYRDSFNFSEFRHLVLEQPVGASKSCRFVTKIFDLIADKPVEEPPIELSTDGIVLCDGVFLQRPELAGRWDYVIYLDVSFDEAMQRALCRHPNVTERILRALYERRYFGGQRIYIDEVDPKNSADVVVDNNDLLYPRVLTDSNLGGEG